MIYLKASIKGTAEKAVAGMFFDGIMYDKAIAELTERFGNPSLISKSLINTFLEIPSVQDENTSSLRLFVDNLHNIARTLKTYGHEADLRAAARMQQIITSENCLKVELETEVQVQEMPFGCASTKENPEKEKPKSNSS